VVDLDHVAANRFVLRTDVKSSYASIDSLMLLDLLAVHIKDERVLNLIGQYLRRTSKRGGSFWDYEKGLARAVRGGHPLTGHLHSANFRLGEIFQ
jgi:RNA-directed DNA polymerase